MPRIKKVAAKKAGATRGRRKVGTKTALPAKASVKKKAARRGRPKGSTSAKAAALGKERDVKQKLRAKLKEGQEQLKSVQDELRAALKREQALIKLLGAKTQAMTDFAAKWERNELARIQKIKTTRRKTRRKRVA